METDSDEGKSRFNTGNNNQVLLRKTMTKQWNSTIWWWWTMTWEENNNFVVVCIIWPFSRYPLNYKSGLRILIWPLKVPFFLVQKWALLAKSDQKNGILWPSLAHYCSLISHIQPLITSQGPCSALIADDTMTHFIPLCIMGHRTTSSCWYETNSSCDWDLK